MKKINFFILLSVSLILLSFSPAKTAKVTKHYFVFVTALEHDKKLEEAEDWDSQGVYITTNILDISCDNASKPGVEIQFTKYYDAEEANANRKLYGYGFTNAWLYDTYDEAYAARRDFMAKAASKNKRRLDYFYVTCE